MLDTPLSPLQKEAVFHLVSMEKGHTPLSIQEWADTNGCTARVVHKWRDEHPGFKRELSRLRDEMDEAKDIFAVRSREYSLMTLQHNLMGTQKRLEDEKDSQKYAALSREVRQIAEAILKATEGVQFTKPVSARDLTDEQLLSRCLKDDCRPKDMTREAVEAALATLRGTPCSTSSPDSPADSPPFSPPQSDGSSASPSPPSRPRKSRSPRKSSRARTSTSGRKAG